MTGDRTNVIVMWGKKERKKERNNGEVMRRRLHADKTTTKREAGLGKSLFQ